MPTPRLSHTILVIVLSAIAFFSDAQLNTDQQRENPLDFIDESAATTIPTDLLPFTKVDAPIFFNQLATTNNGSQIIALGGSSEVYTSNDYGFTFTQSTFANSNQPDVYYSINDVDISGNGEWYFVGATPPSTVVYRCNNQPQFESCWSSTTGLSTILPGITSMDADYTGQHVVVVYSSTNIQGTYAAFSSNFGATFAALPGITAACASVAIDSTGTSIAASSVSGDIFVSTNSGVTFTTHKLYTSTKLRVAASFYTQNQNIYALAQASGTPTMVSRNYGQNWTSLVVDPSSTASSTLIACSGTGQYLIISLGTDMLYSSDYGQSWSYALVNSVLSIQQIAISGDGMNIYLGTDGGMLIYHNSKCLFK